MPGAGHLKIWLVLPIAMACASSALAGGGGRNVLVVVNELSPESLEIGNAYLRARHVPWANLCRIRTTSNLTTDKATYQAEIEAPIEACIAASPYASRIDYIVLTRGMPIRANFPGGQVSIAALLQAMDTPLRGKDQEYNPPTFLDYPNPYVGRDEFFSHAKTFGGYRLYLPTMLSGYWSEDARRLIDRSLLSDLNPPSSAPGATFYLEDARAPADTRNGDFPAAVASLQALGLSAQHVLDSDPNVTSAVMAAHVTGGVYSDNAQAEIASNTYPPGALVCALESFGLVPANFTPGAAPSQVPVTWWITAGATGGHGTVSEPYNVAFPDGFLLEPYVAGYNLAETYFQSIPYLYWMNLVLGDPLAQPYAVPPQVTIDAPVPGATVSGSVILRATSTTPRPEGILRIEFWVDDTRVGSVPFSSGQVSWGSSSVPDGWHRIDVIAYENTARFVQGRASIEVLVDNTAASIGFVDPPPGTLVQGTFPATLSATGGVIDAVVTAEGLAVGSGIASPSFVVDIDTALLGRGWHSLVAAGSTGPAVTAVSAPLEVYVVKPPVVATLGPPDTGPQAGGTLVPIRGLSFEPPMEVLFDGRPGTVRYVDANHVEVTTPTGPPGPVEVRLRNPLGLELPIPDGFTYQAGPCPATDPVATLKMAREPASGRVQMAWDPGADPCWASFRVFGAQDPMAPPTFPPGFNDLTALDEDGAVGSDPGFLYPAPPAGLVLYQVAGEGTDGTLGPP